MQERIVLIETTMVSLRTATGEMNRNLGARVAALESAGGDSWAAEAESRRQATQGAGPRPEAAFGTEAGAAGSMFGASPSAPRAKCPYAGK